MPKTDIIAETVALGQLRHEIRKRQRAVLRKIASKDIQIARLLTEQNELRAELVNIAAEYATAWATRGQPVIPDANDDDGEEMSA